MSPTFICASAASGALGKNVMKSLYSASACIKAAEPPSLNQLSPTASLARIRYSDSGYVLSMVCRSSRDTSKRPFFMAIIALSKSSLSGCLEFTPDSGFALRSSFFLCAAFFTAASAETPASTATAKATAAILKDNRFINPHCGEGLSTSHPPYPQKSRKTCRLIPSRPRAPPPAKHAHPVPGVQRQRRRYRPPAGPHLLGRPALSYREPRRRPLRF